VARGRLGQAILKAIGEGMAVPDDQCPPPPPHAERPAGVGPVIDLLKVLLKMRCEENEVAQKLVATTADLEQIAADDEAPVPALSGWRREIFGRDALALKHGQLALGVARKSVKIVHLDEKRAKAS
jgi:ribonuclease D